MPGNGINISFGHVECTSNVMECLMLFFENMKKAYKKFTINASFKQKPQNSTT